MNEKKLLHKNVLDYRGVLARLYLLAKRRGLFFLVTTLALVVNVLVLKSSAAVMLICLSIISLLRREYVEFLRVRSDCR